MTPDTLVTRVSRLEQQIDDERATLRELAGLVRRLPEDLAVTKERMAAAVKRVNECMRKQEELEDYLRERDREQARERKSDRRWLVGTGLSSAGLVIAALGFLVDKF